MCLDSDLGLMVEKADTDKRGSRQAHDRIVGPETNAEKAEEKIFEEAMREGRIIDGVRTKIDKRK